MKKLSLLLFGAMLLSMAGYSQVKPVLLGRAADVLSNFRNQITTTPQQRITARLMLRVTAADSLPAKVNFRQSLSAGNEFLVGEIENVPGLRSSFVLKVHM